MGRCDKCQHWTPSEDHNVEAAGMRKCRAVRPLWHVIEDATRGMTYGDGNAYRAAEIEALRRARAVVNDGSSYMADLFTGPDFGCVLFATTPEGSETP
jgi:hypothetical protein